VADQPVTVREWTDVVRRARLGRTTKAVALLLATYADYQDGTRVRPGVARLVVEAELSYNVVKRAMAELRAAGLIVLVRPAQAGNHADEYRLALAESLLDRVEVLTPAQVEIAIRDIREAKQGRYKARLADLRPTPGTADHPTPADLRPTPSTADTDLRPTTQAADIPVDTRPAAHAVGHETRPAAHGVYDLRPTPWAPITHERDTTPNIQPADEVRTAVTPSRAPDREPAVITKSKTADTRGRTAIKPALAARLARYLDPNTQPVT
jgi:hypothetical protein